MINIDRYTMQGIKFLGDPWEFVHSLIFLKYGKKINILDLGEGNYSLLFAICSELKDNIKKILSVDMLNKFNIGEKKFYEKKRIFSALSNRGYVYVEHFQGDCFAQDILKVSRTLFLDDPVDLLVLEYMNDNKYMDTVLDTYDFYLSEKTDIYIHNLYKNENSIEYFRKISKGKKHVILNSENGSGIGIIKKD